MPSHQLQGPPQHRDQSMFPPQLPSQGPPPMHVHAPSTGPPPSHMASHSSRSGPPPPPLEQRRSGEHRSSKSTSSKRKAEDEPDMRRDAKRTELSGPSNSHSRSSNVSPQDQRQDQRRDPARSLPSFSVVPTYQQNSANILKERTQAWDQPPNSQPPNNNHRHGGQGSPVGPPMGPVPHNNMPPPSQSRQHGSSSQMFGAPDYGRPQQQSKSSTLPSAMFPSHSHSSSPSMHRPPSMMGAHGRPPSPPPTMRKPTITPPNQHISHGPSGPGPRSPGKTAYGPPLPPPTQPQSSSQTPNSAGSTNHLRSSGGESHRSGLPGSAPTSASRGYGMSKSTSVPSSLSTMGPPLPPLNSMNDSPYTDRLPPSSNNGGPVAPSAPVPVPPPHQLPPVQKYGSGALRLFPASGTGGRSVSG